MKNILILLLSVYTSICFSQNYNRGVAINNYTSYNIHFGTISTISTTNDGYALIGGPSSTNENSGTIIYPNSSYILGAPPGSNGKFPFNGLQFSFGSVLINGWYVGNNGFVAVLTNQDAYTNYGATQIFGHFKYGVTDPNDPSAYMGGSHAGGEIYDNGQYTYIEFPPFYKVTVTQPNGPYGNTIIDFENL